MAVGILIAVLAGAMLAVWLRLLPRLLSQETQRQTYQRYNERTPMRSAGTLNWSDAEGGSVAMAIQAVNLSRDGALVVSDGALTPGGVVLVHFETLSVMTTATVRHCTPCGSVHRIGLEFRHPLMQAEKGSWTYIVQSGAAVKAAA